MSFIFIRNNYLELLTQLKNAIIYFLGYNTQDRLKNEKFVFIDQEVDIFSEFVYVISNFKMLLPNEMTNIYFELYDALLNVLANKLDKCCEKDLKFFKDGFEV